MFWATRRLNRRYCGHCLFQLDLLLLLQNRESISKRIVLETCPSLDGEGDFSFLRRIKCNTLCHIAEDRTYLLLQFGEISPRLAQLFLLLLLLLLDLFLLFLATATPGCTQLCAVDSAGAHCWLVNFSTLFIQFLLLLRFLFLILCLLLLLWRLLLRLLLLLLLLTMPWKRDLIQRQLRIFQFVALSSICTLWLLLPVLLCQVVAKMIFAVFRQCFFV